MCFVTDFAVMLPDAGTVALLVALVALAVLTLPCMLILTKYDALGAGVNTAVVVVKIEVLLLALDDFVQVVSTLEPVVTVLEMISVTDVLVRSVVAAGEISIVERTLVALIVIVNVDLLVIVEGELIMEDAVCLVVKGLEGIGEIVCTTVAVTSSENVTLTAEAEGLTVPVCSCVGSCDR